MTEDDCAAESGAILHEENGQSSPGRHGPAARRLARPRGASVEQPADIRLRLEADWSHLVCAWATGQASFPLEIQIQAPALDEASLLSRAGEIRTWIKTWNTVDPQLIVKKRISRRRINAFDVPAAMRFEDPWSLADWLGGCKRAYLARLLSRIADLRDLDDRLGNLGRFVAELGDLEDREHQGFVSLLRNHLFMGFRKLDVRELHVEGLDGKWIERRRGLVEAAFTAAEMLNEGADFRARLGFRSNDRSMLWLKFHPDDLRGPFGAQQFAVRPTDTDDQMPASISRISIVENLATFNGFDPAPGCCLLFGSGNAISGIAPMLDFLQDREVLYWGYIDSFGMMILSRLRRHVAHVVSVMMDEQTMLRQREQGISWNHEPETDRYNGGIVGLSETEERALSLIRAHWVRIEQEHVIARDTDLDLLGIRRSSSAICEVRPSKQGF